MSPELEALLAKLRNNYGTPALMAVLDYLTHLEQRIDALSTASKK